MASLSQVRPVSSDESLVGQASSFASLKPVFDRLSSPHGASEFKVHRGFLQMNGPHPGRLEVQIYKPKKLLSPHPLILPPGAGNNASTLGLPASLLAREGLLVIACSTRGTGACQGDLPHSKFKRIRHQVLAQDLASVAATIPTSGFLRELQSIDGRSLAAPVIVPYSFSSSVVAQAIAEFGLKPALVFRLAGSPDNLGNTPAAMRVWRAVGTRRFLHANLGVQSFVPVYHDPKPMRDLMFSSDRSLEEVSLICKPPFGSDHPFLAYLETLAPRRRWANAAIDHKVPVHSFVPEKDRVYPKTGALKYGRLIGTTTTVSDAHHGIIFEDKIIVVADAIVENLKRRGMMVA